MMTHANLRTKLSLGFGVLILALAANSLVGYLSVAKLSATMAAVDLAVEKRKLVRSMELGMEQQRAGLRIYLLGSDNLDELEEGKRLFQSGLDQLRPQVKSEEGKALLSSLQQSTDQYREVVDRAVELRRNGKTKDAIALSLSPQAAQIRTAVNAGFAAMLQHQENNKKMAVNEQLAAASETRLLLGIFASVGLVCGVGIAVFVPRSLVTSISAMTSLIDEVAHNNLTVDDVHVTAQDEIGRASIGLNTMKNSLRGLIESIARTAEHVASASEELSSSATQ